MSQFRYERKFFISELSRHEVESIIKLHPAVFSEIYHERYVNNIYFDTEDWTNYFETVDGNTKRVKVRIRWYGELFGAISKPILEYKIKNGLLGRKSSFNLNPFELGKGFRVRDILKMIDESDIPEDIKANFKTFSPTLLNRYRRKYYISNNKEFRITVDTDQVFYRIGRHNNTFVNRKTDDTNVVLELKYRYEMDAYAKYITTLFPFRMTKNAKYVNGIETLYG